jgi:hypothetical protein
MGRATIANPIVQAARTADAALILFTEKTPNMVVSTEELPKYESPHVVAAGKNTFPSRTIKTRKCPELFRAWRRPL